MNNINDFYDKKRFHDSLAYNMRGGMLYTCYKDGNQITIKLTNDALRNGITEKQREDLLYMVNKKLSGRDAKEAIAKEIVEKLEKDYKGSKEKVLKDLGIEIIEVPEEK